jgi:hypothetical protein
MKKQSRRRPLNRAASDFFGLRLAGEIPAGPAVLHIQYQGKINSRDSAGVFQGKDRAETYLDIRETFTPPPPAPADPRTERVAFEFLKSNYDALVKRLRSVAGLDYGSLLPNLGASLCDEDSRQEFVTLFEGRVAGYVGGSRNYANVLESIRLCEARQNVQSADAAKFFSKQ